jgi:uncharacterized caspase-like protein
LTVLLLVFQTITAQTGDTRKLSLIVDSSQIRQLPFFETISNNIRRLPYVKESTDSDWHVRIRPQPGNHAKLLVEREGGAVVGSLSPTDPKLTTKLLSLLETEAKWRIIRSLENLSGNSTIQIEMRAIPVTVSPTGRVLDLPRDRRKPTFAEGQLSEGDRIAIEIRNLGTSDAYITIVDLLSDGSMFQLYPYQFGPTDNRIPPDGKWHRISDRYFVVTPPYGLEVVKIIATKRPLDTQVFGIRNTQASKTITPAFRKLFGNLLDGKTISESKPFNTSDWGTAALSFQIAPKDGKKVVARTETDAPKTNLHILAIGVNQYASPSIPRLTFATKDAQDFAATLARVGGPRFGKVNSKLILDAMATKANISAAFERIITEAEPQDTFVFFYSGMGHLVASSGAIPPQFFLIPSDYRSKDLSNDAAQLEGISAALLQSWFNKIESRHQLIVLDACRSQGAFEAFVSRISKENEALGDLLPRDMVIVGNSDRSYESGEKQNGLLTHTLLKALSTKVEDNAEITARKLLAYAQKVSATLRNLKISSYEIGVDFPLGMAVETLPTNKPTARHHYAQERPRPMAATDFASDRPLGTRRLGNFIPVQSSSTVVRKGKDYALLIAINNYDYWKDLSNPITDARAVADELKKYYGFETEVMENPTKKEIMAALLRYKRDKAYADDDQLFIFFAGHGSFIEDFKEGFIVARDSAVNDDVGDTYISYSLLRKVIDYIPCKHIFLVLDACFSGAFDERIARRGGDPEYEDATNLQFIERKMELQTRRFITSGDKVYVSDGRPDQHSPFSRKLLDALRGYGGKYGVLTINGILAHVERVVPEPRQGEWGGNQPGSDFLFVAKPLQRKSP